MVLMEKQLERTRLAEEARENLLARARRRDYDWFSEAWKHDHVDNQLRFPGFWGPNYDWMPDQCHGGMLMITLQPILMQPGGDKILLFPAWPVGWDVEFTLCAPKNTILEGALRDGHLVEFKITPESRKDDVTSRLKTGPRNPV